MISISESFAGLSRSSRQRAGWVERDGWGEGSVVWLTSLGVESTGLGGLGAVKAPPAPTTIAHGVLVGWSAARAERRGRVWKSVRELALDPDRWEVTRCERGYTKQLSDLAVWLARSGPPIALVAESGGRREDPARLLLSGCGGGSARGSGGDRFRADGGLDAVVRLVSRYYVAWAWG